MLVAFVLVMYFPIREFVAGGFVEQDLLSMDMSGKVILVTGANTGIGFETARQLAKQRATVVMACRSTSRCDAAAASIREQVPRAVVNTMLLDLNSLASVREFAAEFTRRYDALHVLVNNAGIMLVPLARTVDGFESTFGVNHLAHFLLTELLTPMLVRTPASRIVVIASRAQEPARPLDLDDLNWERKPYDSFFAYAQSKLANVLHARSLARRLGRFGVTAVSVHPGAVWTELGRHIPFAHALQTLAAPLLRVVLKSPWEGAQTTLHAALAPSVPLSNGAYFADCVPTAPVNPQATDDALAEALYARSRELVGLPPEERTQQ